MLFVDGYKYSRKRVNKTGSVSWRCRVSGCHATITTTGQGDVLRLGRSGHTHRPNELPPSGYHPDNVTTADADADDEIWFRNKRLLTGPRVSMATSIRRSMDVTKETWHDAASATQIAMRTEEPEETFEDDAHDDITSWNWNQDNMEDSPEGRKSLFILTNKQFEHDDPSRNVGKPEVSVEMSKHANCRRKVTKCYKPIFRPFWHPRTPSLADQWTNRPTPPSRKQKERTKNILQTDPHWPIPCEYKN